MGYREGMGYGPEIPANQVGGSKNLWIIIDYGLSGLWVRRELTVLYIDKHVPYLYMLHKTLARYMFGTVRRFGGLYEVAEVAVFCLYLLAIRESANFVWFNTKKCSHSK